MRVIIIIIIIIIGVAIVSVVVNDRAIIIIIIVGAVIVIIIRIIGIIGIGGFVSMRDSIKLGEVSAAVSVVGEMSCCCSTGCLSC